MWVGGAQFRFVSPKRVVGCRRGSRHVEGCWGFPSLKIKKVVWFLVSDLWFLGVKMFYAFKRYSLHITRCSFHVFLIDMKYISKMFRDCFTRTFIIFGARLLEHCRNLGFPESRDLQK